MFHAEVVKAATVKVQGVALNDREKALIDLAQKRAASHLTCGAVSGRVRSIPLETEPPSICFGSEAAVLRTALRQITQSVA